MVSLGMTVRPRPFLLMTRSGAASSGVRVGSFGAGVVGSSVTTVLKLEPEMVPWLEMKLTPAGIGGPLISARKTISRRWPLGSVPIVTETLSFGAAGLPAAGGPASIGFR